MDNVKRAQVIMLPTENENQGIYLNLVPSINIIHYWNKRISNSYIAQHLYITSDDEIKKGDWIYCNYSNTVHKDFQMSKMACCKKIIATTDTSLFKLEECPIRGADSSVKYILPQPSQQFIEKYIESYNKGEIITNVLVEYDKGFDEYEPNWKIETDSHYNTTFKLKINPKDNTITIKKLKDSWSREELINELEAFAQTYGLVSEGNEWSKKL